LSGVWLALGALAGLWAERSGVINIAIEGMMLLGAAFGFAAFIFTDNITIGVLAAVLVGGLAALLHGVLSISYRTDQIISGTVVNILAIGLTGYLRRQYIVEQGGGIVIAGRYIGASQSETGEEIACACVGCERVGLACGDEWSEWVWG
jgi:simple sugar transport system permease protein